MSTSMSIPDWQPTNPMSSPPKVSVLLGTSYEAKVRPMEISNAFGFTDQVDVEPNSEVAWSAPACLRPLQCALAMPSTVAL